MPPTPLESPSQFPPDITGIISFIGGNDAISAMTSVHVSGMRRWLGWYNNPGSFLVAIRLHSFTRSAFVHISSDSNISKPSPDGVHMDPLALYKLDGCRGPRFRAAHSRISVEETSCLAALFMKECITRDSEGKMVPGRKTQPVKITIANLAKGLTPNVHPARSGGRNLLLASIPISVSIGTCTLSAAQGDWCVSALILLGILASGLFCLLLGSADFTFTFPKPTKELSAGDGILSLGNDFVLLRGTQAAVNSIIHGRFTLCFASEDHCNLLRPCIVLFFIQSISQLFFITRASPFGRIMFLISLGVSAVYNAWLSSSDKGKVFRKLLVETLLDKPTFTKYTLGTPAAAAVLMLLVLEPQDPTAFLNDLLPEDTKVWRRWKAAVVEQVRDRGNQLFSLESRVGVLDRLTPQQQDLLELLYDDARVAYSAYRDYLGIDLL